MDCALSATTTGLPLPPSPRAFPVSRQLSTSFAAARRVVVRAGPSQCEPSSSSSSSRRNGFGGLNAPLEVESAAGRFLSGVLQNQRQLFHVAVADELRLLASERDGASSRMALAAASDEACLHRRISQLKEQECQTAAEDVMYMLIFSKFSEIRVPLVPKLSRCIYNDRLEILPPKHWELESIYDLEVLELVKQHVSAVIGLRVNSSVTDSWATTDVLRQSLGRTYVSSVVYGYFLKSAISRHYLERCLYATYRDLDLGNHSTIQFPESAAHGLSNLVLGRSRNHESAASGPGSSSPEARHESLRSYVLGLDAESLQRCGKLKSKEAVSLIEKHSYALFGDGNPGLNKKDEVIRTSFSSMKRLVLEAVAFGFFLQDAEENVDSIFRLKEN